MKNLRAKVLKDSREEYGQKKNVGDGVKNHFDN